MGLLARIAAALRSAFGRSADRADSPDAADAETDPSPSDPGSGPEDADPSGPSAAVDCSVCGTTFEAAEDECPLCGTAPGNDETTADPEPTTEATDGAATDDAADRLRDLRDE